MGRPGLLYMRSGHKDPQLNYETFNKWYDETLVPKILKAASSSAIPGPPVIVRYIHADGEAKPNLFPYLALYPLPDLDWLTTSEARSTPHDSAVLPDDSPAKGSVDFQMRVYEHIQTFEGQKPHPEGRADRMVIVCSEPSEAKGVSDVEFDEWYRKQHLDMMSMTKGFRRSTRYRLTPPNDNKVVGAETLESVPRFLALYEFDGELDWDAMKMTKNTEWSKKIVQGYHLFQADEWRLYKDFGETERRLGVY